MEPRAEANSDTFRVLKHIKKLLNISPGEDGIFGEKNIKYVSLHGMDPKYQLFILKQIEKLDAVAFEEVPTSNLSGLWLSIWYPEFDEVYAQYGEMEGIPGDAVLFRLTKEGRLYRPGLDEEYLIDENSVRHRIIKELRRRTSRYYATSELAAVTGSTERTIREEIRHIRNQIEKRFEGVKGIDFIQAKRKSGYKLGPKVSITEDK
jgi:hypothetical protein